MLARLTKMAAVSTSPTDEGRHGAQHRVWQTGRRSGMVMLMTSFRDDQDARFRCDYDPDARYPAGLLPAGQSEAAGTPTGSITPAYIQSMAVTLGDMAMLLPAVLHGGARGG